MRSLIAFTLCVSLIMGLPARSVAATSAENEQRILALAEKNHAMLNGMLIKGKPELEKAAKDAVGEQVDVVDESLNQAMELLKKRGADPKTLDHIQGIQHCVTQVGEIVAAGSKPSQELLNKCGATKEEFEEQLKENLRAAQEQTKQLIDTCGAVGKFDAIKGENWTRRGFERKLQKVKQELDSKGQACLEEVKEAYDKLSDSADEIAALFNMAGTVCASSGGNPWACGIAYAIAIIAALFDLGSGGDGDGGKKKSGGNVSSGKGGEKCQNPDDCVPVPPTGQIAKTHGGSTGDGKCVEEGAFLVCTGPGFPGKQRVPLRVTTWAKKAEYVAVAGEGETSTLEGADHKALGDVLSTSGQNREVVVCIPKDRGAAALPLAQDGQYTNKKFAGLAYKKNGTSEWFEIWQLYDKQGKVGPLGLGISNARPCTMFQD